MTALTHFQRAHAIELRAPTNDSDEGHYRWPLAKDGTLVSKAYFAKFGPRPAERVIATDFLCAARLFYAWDDSEGGAHKMITRLESLGWIPTLVEITAATGPVVYGKKNDT